MITTAAALCIVLAQPNSQMADHPPSVHAQHAAQNADAEPLLDRAVFRQPARSADLAAKPPLNRVVYGYLPYWANNPDHIPWEQLTHLSHFSVEMNTDGTLGNDRGWTANGGALVAAGKAHGVKITLTATLFGSAGIATLLGSPTHRQAAIDNLLARVQLHDGEGINIDFEFVPVSQKQNFIHFMDTLTQAFHAAIPGSHVTLATPAVDWHGAYNYSELAEKTDGMAIMGYGYHWTGGNPGPVAPIDAAPTWASRSLRWSINDYMVYGKPENRHKFFLGYPLYGNDWPTTSSAVPGTRAANGTARFYRSCANYFNVSKTWDEASQTPYRVYNSDGQIRQIFCEDDASLLAKLDLITEYDLGGVMWWAVGYVDADHSVWQGIDERFRDEVAINSAPLALATAPDSSPVGDVIILNGEESFDPDGDTLTYQWTATNGPAVSIMNANAAIASATPTTVGTYVFRLEVNDGQHHNHLDLSVVVFDAESSGTPNPNHPDNPGGVLPEEHVDIEDNLQPPGMTASSFQILGLDAQSRGCNAIGGPPCWALLLLLCMAWRWRQSSRGSA